MNSPRKSAKKHHRKDNRIFSPTKPNRAVGGDMPYFESPGKEGHERTSTLDPIKQHSADHYPSLTVKLKKPDGNRVLSPNKRAQEGKLSPPINLTTVILPPLKPLKSSSNYTPGEPSYLSAKPKAQSPNTPKREQIKSPNSPRAKISSPVKIKAKPVPPKFGKAIKRVVNVPKASPRSGDSQRSKSPVSENITPRTTSPSLQRSHSGIRPNSRVNCEIINSMVEQITEINEPTKQITELRSRSRTPHKNKRREVIMPELMVDPTSGAINTYGDRPRTASPKKDRTGHELTEEVSAFSTDKPSGDTRAEKHKKTKKSRKLADRLTVFEPQVTNVGVVETNIRPRTGPDIKRTSLISNVDQPKQKKQKRKTIAEHDSTNNFPESILRYTESVPKCLAPKQMDLSNVIKMATVIEEPAPKKLKNPKKVKLIHPDQNNPKILTKKPTIKKKPKGPTSPCNSLDSSKFSSNDAKLERDIGNISKWASRFPILRDDELIKKFLNVSMTNNQKGRIRQSLKELFKGTDPKILPDVIHNRISYMLNNSKNLTDTELRKIRVLFNMLKLATEALKESSEDSEEKEKKDNETEKKKKKKRYVVFVGNLPLDINKEMISHHFSDIKNFITDVRIPARNEEKKSAIAYLELDNKSAYELALSRHKSMMGTRRIHVMFTTQKQSKMSKSEAKSKRAKLVAMVNSGQMPGSIPINRKRSIRRAKMREAQKLLENKS